MSAWSQFISDLNDEIRDLSHKGCDIPFFRGHENATWQLMPSLGRQKRDIEATECNIYFDFLSYGGPLLQRTAGWDVLFAMQHHGLPTRLLDWSQTFAVALFFAVRGFLQDARIEELPDPAIWVLDPFELNRITAGESVIFNPQTDFSCDYHDAFIIDKSRRKPLKGNIVAMVPTKFMQRLSMQRGVFTLHQNIVSPIEQLYQKCLKKFVLKKQCVPEALQFLTLAGINEFTLFPDLDGLGRYLKQQHV